ncbi:MAG: EF2563 family selenium-dependent molybdenum hydroxylase system protein [Clostridiales bacterium]|mgnify:CR=1 FL=1|nr:EF2563 family selenium-dependent molybdenum hydroxylase system protein [Clostridiales bacterium]
MERELIIVRGGGDIATGVIQKLYRAGLPLLVLETERPMAIRRTVSLCEAVIHGFARVEDVSAKRVADEAEMWACLQAGLVPMAVDPAGDWIARLSPGCVVDAILAKRNIGTHMSMAPVVIGLGPGFAAGQDVHAVVETMRGHDLGRLILYGSAQPNTGIPGELGGKSAERVLHAPCDGVVRHVKAIGDVASKGEVLFYVGETPCLAPFTGLLRGLIAEMPVKRGMKVADIDPRTDVAWNTISDKARCIGGSVLEAYLYLRKGRR